MLDLLTIEEDAEASRQGWGVYYVYDLATNRWCIQFCGSPNAEKATRFVVNQAHEGNALARKALQLIMKGMKK